MARSAGSGCSGWPGSRVRRSSARSAECADAMGPRRAERGVAAGTAARARSRSIWRCRGRRCRCRGSAGRSTRGTGRCRRPHAASARGRSRQARNRGRGPSRPRAATDGLRVRQPATAGTPATSARAAMLTALAPSITARRGVAARVTRIIPAAYSSVTARTARIATTAWPRSTPISESLVGSWPVSPAPRGDACVEAPIAPLAATVSATAPTNSHQVPAIVRSLVHSARSASLTRLSGAARPARRPGQAGVYAPMTSSPAHGGSG